MEKEKVKVKEIYHSLLKYAAFVPLVLLFPDFIADPIDWRIPFLCIVVVYWTLMFMTPYNVIRYLIQKYDMGQVLVDLFSIFSVVGMWGFVIFFWISFTFSEKSMVRGFWGITDGTFPMAIFCVPFIALMYVMGGILSLTLLYKIYYSVIRANK